jgi:hypothetical protein
MAKSISGVVYAPPGKESAVQELVEEGISANEKIRFYNVSYDEEKIDLNKEYIEKVLICLLPSGSCEPILRGLRFLTVRFSIAPSRIPEEHNTSVSAFPLRSDCSIILWISSMVGILSSANLLGLGKSLLIFFQCRPIASFISRRSFIGLSLLPMVEEAMLPCSNQFFSFNTKSITIFSTAAGFAFASSTNSLHFIPISLRNAIRRLSYGSRVNLLLTAALKIVMHSPSRMERLTVFDICACLVYIETSS